jgi:hypothetical protein
VGVPFMRNRLELASAAGFVLFVIVAFAVSTLAALPILVVATVLTLRARALRR